MSGDMMIFPTTWEEFERDYGFTDTEHIYTNGSRLIQSFRVEQWLEHINASRPKGKWIHAEIIDDDNGFGVNSDATQCSICGDYQNSYDWAKTYFHFCPNCGADMRGEEE